jgi:ArsR family transcriptional regulator
MKQLVDAGLVEREQRGRWAYFRLVDGALERATSTLLS